MALASLPSAEPSKGTTGAISELIAAADLMRLGFHVFRALSPNCPADLLVYRTDPKSRRMVDTLRVQVRTAKVHGQVLNFPLKEHDRGTFDILALVAPRDHVYYVPALPGSPTCPYGINIGHLQMLRSWGVLVGAGWQGMRSNLQEN